MDGGKSRLEEEKSHRENYKKVFIKGFFVLVCKL
jgi:hypothetical protein